jgi:NAD+ dependent glucose-6-phosphate dehydrogenase
VSGRRRRVAVTGAAGRIGRVLADRLAADYDLILIDRVPVVGRDATVVDLAQLEELGRAIAGADALVHLAAASDVLSPWDAVLECNLVGAYHAFEAARRAGVPKVVFASSNHVVGWYEREEAPEIYRGARQPLLDHRADMRPDSLYGVSKAFGEELGRYYADAFGLRVVCLRIGSVLAEDDPTRPPATAQPSWLPAPWEVRIRATWLSHRDCAALFTRAIEADVRFAIAYGVSDVPGRFWDLEEAERLLGYRPTDRWPGAPATPPNPAE